MGKIEITILPRKVNTTHFGHINVQFEDDEWKYQGEIAVRKAMGQSYTGVCGVYTLTSPWGQALVNGVHKKVAAQNSFYTSSSLPQYLAKHCPKDFTAIRDALLDTVIRDLCAEYGNYSIMFGGRMNISKQNYVNYFGVHSGTIARHIMLKKCGTITASHLHHNTNHSRPDDYSLQQFFVWTPPSVEIVPLNRAYCGIFGAENHGSESMPKMEATTYKKPEWVMFRPRYILKNPFAEDSDYLKGKKKPVDKAA